MTKLLGSLLTFGLAGATAAVAAEPDNGGQLPAVSGPNGKIAIAGGSADVDGDGSAAVALLTGSYTIPLGKEFGFQIDGIAGQVDNDNLAAGIGTHLFWRNPDVGLVGLTAAHAVRDRDVGGDARATYVGAEAEIYLDQFTFAATAGSVFGDNVDDGLSSTADIMWYATDDFVLRAGAEHSEANDWSASFGAEFRPAAETMPGLSIFADGATGGDVDARVMIGMRVYFGDSLSLKNRHRQDDPVRNVPALLVDSTFSEVAEPASVGSSKSSKSSTTY